MALELRLQQKLAQQLIMSPQLQQAIKLLQLSHLELTQAIQDELDQNPVLEDLGGADADADTSVQLNGNTPEANTDSVTGNGSDNDGMMGLAVDAQVNPAADSSDMETTERSLPSSEAATDAGTNDAPQGATAEPSSQEVQNDIDWNNYDDTYSYSMPPGSSTYQGDDELPSYEATVAKPQSLVEHLRWQLGMTTLSDADKTIGLLLIDEINDDGYLPADALKTTAEETLASIEQVEAVLREIQAFDPVGVGSRTLRECLLAQAERMATENPWIVEIIEHHLHHVQNHNITAIAKALKAPQQEIAKAVKMIGRLEPRPGRIYSDRQPQYIVPDIYVHKVGNDYVIVLNEDGLPRLRISNYYKDVLSHSIGHTKSYIQDKLRNATWLIRSIHMRQRTIYKVMEAILKFQRDFFDKGVQFLKPLVLKDVADIVSMHESTISRVTSNKYVHTPRGIFELKYFFNSSIQCVNGESIASESVRDHIQRLVNEEDPRMPHSDETIVFMLKKFNVDVARRTVAKYRDMLGIPSSSRRKNAI